MRETTYRKFNLNREENTMSRWPDADLSTWRAVSAKDVPERVSTTSLYQYACLQQHAGGGLHWYRGARSDTRPKVGQGAVLSAVAGRPAGIIVETRQPSCAAPTPPANRKLSEVAS